jgi:signal transduction histidine kinase
MAEAIREIGLPLHILLEHRFGELNENQVEMVATARDSSERADGILRRVQRIRSLESRPRSAAQETSRLTDLCRAPLAIVRAREEARGVRVEDDIALTLPRVRGLRIHLEEGLTLLIGDAASHVPDGASLTVIGSGGGEAGATLSIEGPIREGPPGLDRLLAVRLLEVEGATVESDAGSTRVTFAW